MSTTKDDRAKVRIYAKGEFELISAAHFGGSESGLADMNLLRDEDGSPFIPGSSLAGAGRSYLARRLLPWSEYAKGPRAWDTLKLFGYSPAPHDNLTMSPLRVADAKPVKVTSSLRDDVRLDSKSGVAADKAKYDYEVVEAGGYFLLQFQCLIRENDPEDEITQQFYGLLHALANGEIRIGGRTSRGLGRGKVKRWEIAHLEMDQKDHVLAWLRNDPWFDPRSELPPDTLPDKRSCFRIQGNFNLKHSLLIREELFGQDMPDFRHLHSAENPVASGTSTAGALRTQVELIARTLWNDNEEKVTQVLAEMFGPVHKKESGREELWRSRVTVEETLIKGGVEQWQDRVAIDRFTGGALDRAKFNEAPWVSGERGATLRLDITLENPIDFEIGLLLLALKDFWLGRANLGGEASLGRGRLRGERALLTLRHCGGNHQRWLLQQGQGGQISCGKGDKDSLEKFVEAAKDCPKEYNPIISRRSLTELHNDVLEGRS